MTKLHITQQDDGYWMLSVEDEAGALRRLSSHHLERGHLIEDALDMTGPGEKFEGGTVIIESPSTARPVLELLEGVSTAETSYRRREPRRARL